MNYQTFKIIFVVLCLEIVIYSLYYCHGNNGLKAMKQLQADTQSIQEEIIILKNHLDQLKITIDAWDNDPFYKEKIAREQLQMMYNDEQVFYLDKEL